MEETILYLTVLTNLLVGSVIGQLHLWICPERPRRGPSGDCLCLEDPITNLRFDNTQEVRIRASGSCETTDKQWPNLV